MTLLKNVALIMLAGVSGLLIGRSIYGNNPAHGVVSAAAQQAEAPLPKDIDPKTRNRFPELKLEDMDPETRKLAEDTHSGKHFTPGLRMYSPRLAEPLSKAHYYLKYESGLGDRYIEIAVLMAARGLSNQYEWTQWEGHARKETGDSHLDDNIIDIIKYRKPVVGLGEKETAIIKMGRGIFDDRKVSPEVFADTVRLFGRRGTVDVVELMGLYSQTAVELIAFDQQLNPGQKPLLPAR
jgi:4-carboxymuconolactone decarboxylase